MTTAVVTGANRGIGLELCRQLHARGTDVIAVCRKPSPELESLGIRIESGIDVASEPAVTELARRLAGIEVGILINNAGILRHEGLDSMDFAAIREQLEVNALGPLRVTHALLPLMGRGSKIALVTSRMGSIADNSSGGAYGYRMSKAALNAAGVSLARDLQARGIAVVILHPGYVRTDMTRGHGMIDAAESASGLLARIDELSVETSGRFLHENGEELPW
jgi:NAD(P)-dependent dehydrogenase (short-subunit alcohol dehydrogenase family)